MYNPVVNQALRLHRRRKRALRQHRPRQRLPGGRAGAEGQPGHALHPDHLATTAGTCTQNIYAAGHAARQGQDPGRRPCPALLNDLKANGLLDKHAGRDGGRIRPHGGSAHRRRAAATTGRSSSPSSPAAASRAARSIGATNATRLATRPISAGRRSATSTRKISRPRSTRRWASTGPPSGATIPWAAASSMCRRPAPSRSCRFTNSGDRATCRAPDF